MRVSSLPRKVMTILAREGLSGVTSRLGTKARGTKAAIRREWRRLTFKPEVVEKRYGDIRFRFYIANTVGEEYYGKLQDARLNKSIEVELAWLADATRSGEVIADVGAHHGYFTVLFGCWVGSKGRVFAFECVPENCAIALRNARLNELECVQVIPKAVGARTGTVEVATNSGGIRVDRRATPVISVEMLALDEFFTGRTPDLLKIDVEGWEIEVLKGARRCLAGRPKFALELHCAKYENRVAEVQAILGLLPVEAYEFRWAPEAGERLLPFAVNETSAALIAGQQNPHLYGVPLERRSEGRYEL